MRFKKLLQFFSGLAFLLAFAVPMSAEVTLPTNSGKVAFLKSHESVSSLEQPALNFFLQNIGGEENVITTSETIKILASDYDCIWIHIDRYDIGQGYMELPREFVTTKVLSALKNYLREGGNLLLTGHATQLLVAINRIDSRFSPNEFNSGNNNNNDNNSDDWTVNPILNYTHNHKDHAIYKNLSESDFSEDVKGTFGLQFGGREVSTHRDDHNCMWNLTQINLDGSKDGDKIEKFEDLTYSCVLGTWGQAKGDDNAGIVEFYPLKYSDGKYQGTIIANGLAAYSWNGLDRNVNADNLRLLTANMIAYLADPAGVKPYNPDAGWELEIPKPTEILESTGKVGLFVGYTREQIGNEADYNLNDTNHEKDHLMEREQTLCGNFEEKAVYDWFVKTYGEKNVIFADEKEKISKKYFDCIWIHASRSGIEQGYNNLPDAFKLSNELNAFVKDGGNLFLSCHAAQIAEGMGRVRGVDVFGSTYKPEKSNNDSWDMKIKHYDNDWSDHVLFQNFANDIDYAYDYDTHVVDYNSKVIRLMSGVQIRHDYNCLWKIENADLQRKKDFCDTYNCEILGTWGHVNGEDGAGFVIFYPKKDEASFSKQHRITVADDIVNRRGTIIANGLAAYQWHVYEGENGSQDYVEKLTNSVLQYLSPVVDEETIDKGDFAEIQAFYSLDHIRTNGYVIDNPETGEGHHTYSEYKIEDLIDYTTVQHIEVTPVKDTVWIATHNWDDAIHGKDAASHAKYHGWYFGQPTAIVDENDDFILTANVAGHYLVDLTTIYGNTYHFTVELFPRLNDQTIYFEGMSALENNQVTFGEGLTQEKRDNIQLYTNHWGPMYYLITYKDSAKAKLFRVAAEDESETSTEEYPTTEDGATTLTNKSTSNKFDLRNAESMMVAQKVNGVMSNIHPVTFADVPTNVDGIEFFDNVPVRFYTLDGKQIAFPTVPGIYVKVSEGKAQKIVVK